MASHDSHDYELIDQLAEDFAERFRRGERPSLQEYVDRYPHLASDIRELLPAMVEMEALKPKTEASAGIPAGTTVPVPELRQLGEYRILREVGQGGMGVVYEAEQLSLGRRVALKVLPGRQVREARQKRRFEREARAAARLHHTNIVPVFGVGEQDGLPYYVMQFIQGLGLDQVIEELARMHAGKGNEPATSPPGGELRVERKVVSAENIARSLMTGEFHPGPKHDSSVEETVGPGLEQPAPDDPKKNDLRTEVLSGSTSSAVLPGHSGPVQKKQTYWQSVASIGQQVASALDHAHKQGIQHRDIKPSNLLLDTRGTVWVTDFGLAKVANPSGETGENLTHTGDILGTLRYMSPEAFDGRTDPRSDVYSLGLTLYELLLLRPAFEEKDRHRLIKQVMTSEPARLDRLNPAIPRDLATIVHKAIEREPGRRYQTADDLGEDLRRFLDDEPIQARRISTLERLTRWSRHNKGLAAALSAVALLLVVLAVGSTLAAARFQVIAREKTELAGARETERLKADKAREDAEKAGKAEAAQRQRAEANFARAIDAVNVSLTAVSEDELLKAPGMQALRQRLLQSALEFYEGFLRERGDDPTIRAGLAAAYLRVGNIHSELGQGPQARQAFQEAQTRFARLVEANPSNVEMQHGLAESFLRLGQHEQAIAIWTRLVQPNQSRFQSELGNACNSRATLLGDQKKTAEALDLHQQALVIRERLVALDPDNPDFRRDLGGTLNNIGVLLSRNNRKEEALVMYRRGVEHARIAWARAPQSLLTGRFLAIGLRNVALMEQQQGRDEEALRSYQESLDVWRQLALQNPAVPNVHAELLKTSREVALYQNRLGQKAAAEQSLYLARTALQRLPQDGADNLFLLASVHALSAASIGEEKTKLTAAEVAEQKKEEDLAMRALSKAVAAGYKKVEELRTNRDLAGLRGRADFQDLVRKVEVTVAVAANAEALRQAELEKLRALLREAEKLAQSVAASAADKRWANEQIGELKRQLAALDPTFPNLKADQAAALLAIGLVQFDLGRFVEARKSLEHTVALHQALVSEYPINPQYRLNLGSAHLALGKLHQKADRLQEAARAWKTALEILLSLLEQDPRNAEVLARWAAAELNVGAAFIDLGLFEEAAAHYARVFEKQPQRNISEWRTHALLRLLVGDVEGSRRVCREMDKHFKPQIKTWEAHAFTTAASLLPGGFPDPDRLVAEATAWAEVESKDGWRNFYAGLACYRAGRFEEAASLVRETPTWAQALPVQAMICQRQGKTAEARSWLAKADSVYQAELLQALKDPTRVFLQGTHGFQQDRMQFFLLLHEARTLLQGKPAARDNWMNLLQARQYARLGQDARAEAALAASVADQPDNPAVWLARGWVYWSLGRKDAAQADFARAAKSKGADPMPWIEHGRLLAEQGDHVGTDQAFARAASLTPNELNRFLEAGWWVVGPYSADMQQACPPEKEADPSRPVASMTPGQEEKWRRVPTGEFGTVNLEALFPGPNRSAYALTYVYSPDDRPVLLRIGSNDTVRCEVRVWHNGRLLHETGHATFPPHQDRVPVQLSRGRNTLLVRFNKINNDHAFALRIADNPLDQAFEKAALGLWSDAAADLTRLDQRGQINHWWQRHYFAICLAAAEDWEAYRKYAITLVKEFHRQPADPYDLGQIAGMIAGVIEDKDELVRLGERLASKETPGWWCIPAGLVFYRAGKFEQALAQFEKIKDTEADPRGLVGRALAHHALGNADEARRWLNAATELYDRRTREALGARPCWFGWPAQRWNHFAQFQIMHREARTLIEGELLDSNREALHKRAHEVWQNQDPATGPYDLALGINPWEPRLWLARARRYAELKRDQDAVADFARAVALRPNDPQVWKQRGRVHAELGLYDRAAADFVKALDLIAVKDIKHWMEDRGGIDSTLVQWDEVFRRVVELRPKDRTVGFHRLQYLGKRNQWREAAALSEKLLEQGPFSLTLSSTSAPIFLQVGDQQAYRRVCRELVEAYSKTSSPGDAQQTALTCLLSPEALAPQETLKRLAQTGMGPDRPTWARGWSELTWALAHLRTGDPATAVKALKDVPKGSPVHQAIAATVLALACHAQNQVGEARQALTSARQILEQRQQQFERGLLYAGNEWHDWLRCRILFREAEARIEGKKAQPER